MNYLKIYNCIILKRKQVTPEEYTERHHIIPKSLGGNNSISNLVRLTAREHFICHLLLVKIYSYDISIQAKMICAVNKMFQFSHNQKRYCPSKWYAICREKLSEVMKINQKGNKNSQYGKRWFINPQTGEKKFLYPEEVQIYLDKGWIKGRSLKSNKAAQVENTSLKKVKEEKKLKFERSYICTNKITGQIQVISKSKINELDDNGKSTYYILDQSKNYLEKQLLEGKTLGDMAKEFNISYDAFYSWYKKKYAKDIKLKLKTKRNQNKIKICPCCKKKFINEPKRVYCSQRCWKISLSQRI